MSILLLSKRTSQISKPHPHLWMGLTWMRLGERSGGSTGSYVSVLLSVSCLNTHSSALPAIWYFSVWFQMAGIFNISRNTRNLERSSSHRSIKSIIYLCAWLGSGHWKRKPDLPSPGWGVSLSSLLISSISFLLSANKLGSEGSEDLFFTVRTSPSVFGGVFLRITFPVFVFILGRAEATYL